MNGIASAQMVAPVELGGFALDRRIGRGGMADVWLGHHRTGDLPAAIKVITRRQADEETYLEGLRREVRAVAGLDHPNIVPVFDAGTVDAAAERASGGELVAGSPWLAMLYAEHGELRRLPHPMPWPLLRDVLLQILDGLAHAHARGVIHRDLKPENVLLHVESDRLRLMLTDFGIAHVIDGAPIDGTASTNSAGTPHYMAPEQFKGHWRDYGPWTDLYALGCMAFELATGQPPFTDRSVFGIAQKHLTAPLPPVIGPEPMPAGFGAWVARMMQREPHQRFQAAADAARALGSLAAPDAAAARAARLAALERLGAAEQGPATEVSNPDGIALADTRDVGEVPAMTLACVLPSDGARALAVDEAAPLDRGGVELACDEPPPMPETWFVDTPDRPLLRGVGLGLFGVRALPFVDRDAQRDALWSALRDVRANRHSRLVVLEGLEGSGKSRLAEWFARRATEVGAAEPVRVHHSAMDAPGDALAAAVEFWFRGQGLDRPRLEARIRRRLTALDPERAERIAEIDAPALARFVRPEGEARIQAHHMTPWERFGAVHAWLHALGRRRPVVLLLDDIQWCGDTVSLIEWLISSACPLPVLIVATLRADLCCKGTPERETIARLDAHPRAARIPIGPLADADHRRVIRDMLGLHPFLADRLLERSGGNPLFALQIVTDWIERDALAPSPQGYTCNGTALVDVPPDLPTLAGRRFDRLAAGFPDPDAVYTALYAAAALGHAVCMYEWGAVVAALGLDGVPEGLEEALYDAGLARPARQGWVFGHGFARAALVERARAAGRWTALNRACAEAVRGGRAPDERRARHLMHGGEGDAAVTALLTAARSRLEDSEYGRALSLCEWRDHIIQRMDLPADDVRRVEALPVEVEALRFQGRFEEAAETLLRLRRFPFGAENPFLLAECERLRGGQAFAEGHIDGMLDGYRSAIDLYRAAGDARGEARARHGVGWALNYFGRYAAAERAFVASHAVAARAGLRVDEGWALHGIGSARMFGERPDARSPLVAARAIFRETATPAGLLGCRLFLAEIVRQEGDLEGAHRLARGAYEIGRAVGSQIRFMARTVVAMLDLELGRADAARTAMLELQREDGLERTQRQYGPSFQMVLARLALVGDAPDLSALVRARRAIEGAAHHTFMHPGSRAALIQVAEALDGRGLVDEARRWWRLGAQYHEGVDADRSAACAARAG